MQTKVYLHFHYVGTSCLHRESSLECEGPDTEGHEEVGIGSVFKAREDMTTDYVIWDFHTHCLDSKDDIWEKHFVLIPKHRWLH